MTILYRIQIRIEAACQGQVEARLLRAAARAALTQQQAPGPATLTIKVTGDEALQALNRDYLGHDYPTDVLSFPASETDPDTQARYLGDLAISLPRARAQAEAGGHPLEAELQLLVAHGVLHLLGHDHARAAERKRMWAAQADILRALGAPISGPAQ